MDCETDALFNMGSCLFESELIHDDSNEPAAVERDAMMLCHNTDDNHLRTQGEGMFQMVQENVDGAQQDLAAARVQMSTKKVCKPKFIPMWTEENGTQHTKSAGLSLEKGFRG